MADSDETLDLISRRVCGRLLALASFIVPGRERLEWREEWEAEVAWRWHELARRGRLGPAARAGLVGRCLGALVHAAWLRKEDWTIDMLLQDLRYAVRVLLGRPTFTLLAVVTLALGIGANTAIFSVVDGVLLKPLPYREPARLVEIWETNPLRNWTEATVAPANLLDWRDRSSSFEAIAYYTGSDTREAGPTSGTLTGGGEAEHLRSLFVSTNFFAVLGVAPALGRDFLPREAIPGSHRVVMLSHGLWQRRFGANPAVVGSTVRLGGIAYQVAGVMPDRFRFGSAPIDLWAPIAYQVEQYRALRRPHFLRAVARLKRGVTLEGARAEMTTIARALEREYPDTNTKMGVGLGPLDDWFVGKIRVALLVFLGAVGLLLLIACSNVANLVLAHAVGRTREIAVRTALGAARLRLVQQLLTESLLLSAAGGLGGLALAVWGVRAFVALSPPDLPRLDEIGVETPVLLFTMALTSVTGLLFGLAPALHVARLDPVRALGKAARGATRGGGSLRRFLVVAEVALAFVLVVGAGLTIRSFVRLQHVNPGFDPSNLLALSV